MLRVILLMYFIASLMIVSVSCMYLLLEYTHQGVFLVCRALILHVSVTKVKHFYILGGFMMYL